MMLSKTLLLVPLGFALVAPAFAHDSDDRGYGDYSRHSRYRDYRRAEDGHRYYWHLYFTWYFLPYRWIHGYHFD